MTTDSPGPARPRALAGAVLAFLLAAAAAHGLFLLLRPPSTLRGDAPPVYGTVPSFTLTDESGRPLGSGDLAGKVWIADFIFTRCRNPCPQLTHTFEGLQRDLPSEARIVSITVDPAFDTPEVLAAYAGLHGAQPGRWHFLTGDRKAIVDLLSKGFLQAFEEQAGAPERIIVHSSYFVLVDRDGGMRAYRGLEPDSVAALVRDARVLLAPPLRSVRSLPAVNASLNASAGLLLLAGLVLIRARRPTAHAACMIAAMGVSAAFLICYLVYHFEAGSARFPGGGTARTAYLAILASHTVLAAAVPVLALRTAWLGWKELWDSHRKWAKVTMPVWLYVSITGVVIYVMLYRVEW
ncbi:MAG: DUF420 domain-containing protein [Planctomycetes bacterium]|nr:DUF420 domain-containing protein [Planctomycetota bacterium]